MEHHMDYCVLRGVDQRTMGFVRIETMSTELILSFHADALPTEPPLRLMLVSAGEEGAVLDLGCIVPDMQGRVSQTISHPAVLLSLWDAIALAEDWPNGRLIAAGWLKDPPGPLWRLMEAAARFLAVPNAGAIL